MTEDDSAVMVRPALPDDVDAISARTAEVQALHTAARPDVFVPGGPDTLPPARVRDLLTAPDRVLLVADMGGRVVGRAYAEEQRKPATPFRYAVARLYINQMAVVEVYRGRGIGTRLLTALRDEARARQLDGIALDVWAFNVAAQRFYERAGLAPERVYPHDTRWTRHTGGSAGAV